MSRIFDALQRSQSEGQSFDFPLVAPMVSPSVAMAEPPAAKVEAEELVPNGIPHFKSVAISTLPDSRLVASPTRPVWVRKNSAFWEFACGSYGRLVRSRSC